MLFVIYTRWKEKNYIFGDSITELGIKKGGYIDLLNNRIASNGQVNQYEFLGAGIGGNKIYDLYLRLEKDVLNKNPNVVVIWVGVNDVWHKSSKGTGTDYDKFGLFYDAVVQKIQANGARVIIVTPAVIGERNDQSNPQDGELNLYANWIRKYAAQKKRKTERSEVNPFDAGIFNPYSIDKLYFSYKFKCI